MVTYNRRRHRRVSANGLVVQLQVGEVLRPCIVENLSTGGIFIRTSELSPVGAKVLLVVTRPGMKKPIRITGRVASSLDTQRLVGMGIEFQSVEPEDVSRLASLLVELGAVEAKGAPAPRAELATAPALPPAHPSAAANAPSRAAVTAPAAAAVSAAPPPRARAAPQPPPPPAPAREAVNPSMAEKRIKVLQEELAKARAAVEEKDKQLARFRTELDRVRFELKTKDDQLLRLGAKKR